MRKICLKKTKKTWDSESGTWDLVNGETRDSKESFLVEPATREL